MAVEKSLITFGDFSDDELDQLYDDDKAPVQFSPPPPPSGITPANTSVPSGKSLSGCCGNNREGTCSPIFNFSLAKESNNPEIQFGSSPVITRSISPQAAVVVSAAVPVADGEEDAEERDSSGKLLNVNANEFVPSFSNRTAMKKPPAEYPTNHGIPPNPVPYPPPPYPPFYYPYFPNWSIADPRYIPHPAFYPPAYGHHGYRFPFAPPPPPQFPGPQVAVVAPYRTMGEIRPSAVRISEEKEKVRGNDYSIPDQHKVRTPLSPSSLPSPPMSSTHGDSGIDLGQSKSVSPPATLQPTDSTMPPRPASANELHTSITESVDDSTTTIPSETPPPQSLSPSDASVSTIGTNATSKNGVEDKITDQTTPTHKESTPTRNSNGGNCDSKNSESEPLEDTPPPVVLNGCSTPPNVNSDEDPSSAVGVAAVVVKEDAVVNTEEELVKTEKDSASQVTTPTTTTTTPIVSTEQLNKKQLVMDKKTKRVPPLALSSPPSTMQQQTTEDNKQTIKDNKQKIKDNKQTAKDNKQTTKDNNKQTKTTVALNKGGTLPTDPNESTHSDTTLPNTGIEVISPISNSNNSVKTTPTGKEETTFPSSGTNNGTTVDTPTATATTRPSSIASPTKTTKSWASIVGTNRNSNVGSSPVGSSTSSTSSINGSVGSTRTQVAAAAGSSAQQRQPPDASPHTHSKNNVSIVSSSSSVIGSGNGSDKGQVTLSEEARARLTVLGNQLKDCPLSHDPIPLIPRGLRNSGNLCYIHAPLQALVSCPSFYQLFKSIKLPSSPESTTNVTDAVVKFVHHFKPYPRDQHDDGKNGHKKKRSLLYEEPFYPNFIYDMLMNSKSCLSVEGRQEDAEEFLCWVLSKLHDEMVFAMQTADPAVSSDVKKEEEEEEPSDDDSDEWQEVGPKNKTTITRRMSCAESPISKMFGGKLQSTLNRQGMKETVTVEPFFSLQLDIQSSNIHSVEDALEMMCVRESISLAANEKEGGVNATRRMTLAELPNYLILHIKRFYFDGTTTHKITKQIDYDQDLEIPKELLSVSIRGKISPSQRMYKLWAVICHQGKTVDKGHYICDVYHNATSSWIRVNDNYVKMIPTDYVFNPSRAPNPHVPYLLFYRQFDPVNRRI